MPFKAHLSSLFQIRINFWHVSHLHGLCHCHYRIILGFSFINLSKVTFGHLSRINIAVEICSR